MSAPSLRDCLASLPSDEILRITEPVDIHYFPTALVMELDRRRQYPVVILEKPAGFDIPFVANLFASGKRIHTMIGVNGEDEFQQCYLKAESEPVPPVVVSDGPVREAVLKGDAVDLRKIPLPIHFEGDGGRYLPSGIIVAKDPDTGIRNLSYARMQLKGPRRLAVSMHSRGHLWDYHRRAEAKGQDLEVAILIGPHPAVYLAAASKPGITVDEYDIAGGLLRQPVELVPGVTVDVEAPANAEIVIEGRILAHEREDEGPFGEYTGYSTSRSTRNVIEVTAITHRENPIFVDIIPGNSAEHLNLCRVAKQARVFQRLKEVVPTVRALNIPKSGTLYHAYLSMERTTAGQARHALMLLFGLDPYLKLAVAVDDDIDVFNEEEVLWAVATRVQAHKDIFIVSDVFCNRLDPSATPEGTGAKIGIDATMSDGFGGERLRVPRQTESEVKAFLDQGVLPSPASARQAG